MNKLTDKLKGSDLRSIGKANEIALSIITQNDFDELFEGFYDSDRKVVMRTADTIEKVTLHNADFLQKHKNELIDLLNSSENIELKWHLALLLPRLNLKENEIGMVWHTLTKWATDKKESKIVRVNSIQGLCNLLQQRPELLQDFSLTLTEVEKDNIASINARIRKIRNASR